MRLYVPVFAILIWLYAVVPARAEPIVVQRDWVSGASFVGFHAAEQNGFYADEGLVPTFIPGGPQVDFITPVVSGVALAGSGSSDALILARARGEPVVALAAVYRRSPITFFALEDMNIRGPKDFVGRRIRVTPNLAPALAYLMDRFGIPPGGYETVTLASNPNAVLEKDADVWGAYVNGLPAILEARGHRLTQIYPEEYGYRGYARVIFTSESTLRTSRDALIRYVRASLRGWRWVIENVDDAVAVVRPYELSLANNEILQQIVSSVPFVHTGQEGLGRMSEADWQRAIDILSRVDASVAVVNPKAMFDPNILDEAERGASN